MENQQENKTENVAGAEGNQNSKGHDPGSRDEKQQQADKPMADSPATAGVNNRDEDAADPERAGQGTSKGFDRDQEELELGLDDGDLDNDR
jgi:hypothetical protein